MASIALSAVFSTAAASLFQAGTVAATIAGMVGRLVGYSLGSMIDAHVMRALTSRDTRAPLRATDRRAADQVPVVPLSEYGAPIPIVYGLARVAGQLLWMSEFRPVTIDVPQELDIVGDQTETITQTVQVEAHAVDFAVLICEGEIAGVSRVWLGGKLAYDRRRWSKPAIGYTSQQLHVEIYLGTEDQMPSPTIQAHLGAAQTPAYRGRAYLVFKDIIVQKYETWTVPDVEVEVISRGHQIVNTYPHPRQRYEADIPPPPPLPDGETYDFFVHYQTPGQAPEWRINDVGNEPPVSHWANPVPVKLYEILGDLSRRGGLPLDRLDMTEMTDEVIGYLVSQPKPASSVIADIMSASAFVVQERDGKLAFLRLPQPLRLRSHEQTCAISERGIVVNSLHDILGRDGYFSSSSGTSEGQFTAIHACCLAYEVTGAQTWRDRADLLASALEPIYYGRPVPDSPALWIPHWLVNAKRPIQLESHQDYYKLRVVDAGGHLEGFIPDGPGHYGERVKRIDQAYRSTMAKVWEYIAGAPINMSYLAAIRRAWYWTDYDNPPFTVAALRSFEYMVNEPTLQGWTYDVIGTEYVPGHGLRVMLSKPPGYDPEIDRYVVLAYTLTEVGPWLEVGGRYEAWPHWRETAEGEVDCAVDSLYWADDAYESLYAITADPKWAKARAANAHSLVVTHAVGDGRNWIRPHISGSAFSLDGTFANSDRQGVDLSSFRRDSDGNVTVYIPGRAGEVQFGRGIRDRWRNDSDTVRVEIGASAPVEVYVWLDTALTYSPSTRYYALVSLAGTGVQTFDLERGDFFLRGQVTGPALDHNPDLYAVGVSVFQEAECTLTIRRIRPYPEVPIEYPHAPPYTANMLRDTLIDWRGSPGTGYTFPHVWQKLGDPQRAQAQAQFLRDAQLEYQARLGDLGPFIPAYYRDRPEEVEYGPANTWGFNWVDPNSQWGGYQYRALQSAAHYLWLSGSPVARQIVADYLGWLNREWTSHALFPPTDFPAAIPGWQPATRYKTGPYNAAIDFVRPSAGKNGFVYRCLRNGVSGTTEPAWPLTLGATVIDGGIEWRCDGYHYAATAYGNYHEPHMVALFMRAALYADLADASLRHLTRPLLARGYAYLDARYVTSGQMEGSWSARPDETEWWIFWHAEIIITLAELLKYGSAIIAALGMDAAKIRSWIDGSDLFLSRWTRHA